jgi:class 3 adenylate cyclase
MEPGQRPKLAGSSGKWLAMLENGPRRVGTSDQTSTFLFTDIEGSTRLWEEQREAMPIALEAHDSMLRAAVERSGGNVVKTTGDGLLASFDRPEAALTAAIAAQLALDAHHWPGTRPLRVRIGRRHYGF